MNKHTVHERPEEYVSGILAARDFYTAEEKDNDFHWGYETCKEVTFW